jgi:hypothetical protein
MFWVWGLPEHWFYILWMLPSQSVAEVTSQNSNHRKDSGLSDYESLIHSKGCEGHCLLWKCWFRWVRTAMRVCNAFAERRLSARFYRWARGQLRICICVFRGHQCGPCTAFSPPKVHRWIGWGELARISRMHWFALQSGLARSTFHFPATDFPARPHCPRH